MLLMHSSAHLAWPPKIGQMNHALKVPFFLLFFFCSELYGELT